MIQAQCRADVAAGLQRFGVAPGGRKMMDAEAEAADLAIQSGIYCTYRSCTGVDCTRVGPSAKCFCGCLFSAHTFATSKSVYPRCTTCPCKAFAFVPRRPEEVGEWWLPRRKGFNVHTWRAKCRCGHGHDAHNPVSRRCGPGCSCGMFTSNFACLVCDKKWEDHETVFETAMERRAADRPVGDEFRPLASDPTLQQLVFPGGDSSDESQAAMASHHAGSDVSRFRPAQTNSRAQAEKSVCIMAASSGGRGGTGAVAKMWGRVQDDAAPCGNAGDSGGDMGASNKLAAGSRSHAAPQISSMNPGLTSKFKAVYD